MQEVNRNLARKLGLTAEQLAYREGEMRRNLGDAWIENYEEFIPAMTNHPKDRHVLAAAIACKADRIITLNVRDFPESSLNGYGISILTPGDFLTLLYWKDPLFVEATLRKQAARIKEPVAGLLRRLAVNAPEFVAALPASFGAGII